MLEQGFYFVEWETHRWTELVKRLQEEGKVTESPERMGFLTLVRKAKRRERLPKIILVLKWDWALYRAFWFHGGEAKEEEALKVTESIAKLVGREIARSRDWLQKQAPVIVIACGYLEQKGTEWWAGVRHPRTKATQRLFRVEWLMPTSVEPKEIVEGEKLGCFARF